MGKIRVKTLGIEEEEKQQKKEAKKKADTKKTRLQSSVGQIDKVETVEKPEEEEIIKQEVEKAPSVRQVQDKQVSKVSETEEKETKKTVKKEKFAKNKKQSRSQKYQTVVKMVDKNKTYPLKEALELLPKLKISSFDETVELHINTIETGISGNLTLPHGTGKKTRVAIADDAIIAAIEKGKIDFDVLLASPQMMPKLAKVARILGPKGLMPNPKNGTISQKPEDLIKKYEAGQVGFKTEAKTPIIHLSVGKLSFGDKKLLENVKTAINTIQVNKIKNVTLKSTMSPGIKINFNESS
ncbi:MAG: hypothetical protein Q7K55_07080 [Candidatus Levybacteria bacterium]|nr:hypothetical protein [Candidatus Levybacteria bacterium]